MNFKLFIISLLLVISCKAPCRKESDIKRNYVNQDLKDFFIFKKGTYWVYENQDKTKTDSIYVSDYQSTWTPVDNILCSQDENIFYTWRSSGKHLFAADSVNFRAEFFTKSAIVQSSVVVLDGVNLFSIVENKPYVNGDGDKREDRFFNKNYDLNMNNTQYESEYYKYANVKPNNLFLKNKIGILGWVHNSDTFNLKSFELRK